MADTTRLEQFLNHIAHPDEYAPTPQTKMEFLLEEIADNKGGGGSSLPPVTAEDNGDVLTVVDGEWGKAAPSSGADAFYIRISWDNDAGGGEGAYVTDQSFADILQAVADGKLIFVYAEDSLTWTVTVWADDDEAGPYVCASFMLFNPTDEAFDYTLYKINQDGVTDSYYRVATVST